MTYQIVPMRVVMVCIVLLTLFACQPSSETGPQTYTVGLITNNSNGLKNAAGFKAGMAELGYVEGQNITYLFEERPIRGAELESALQVMIDAKVDLIFTAGTPTGVAAHKITAGTGVPVVFGVIADPVAAGVMNDLARPGGNMTGVKLSQNQARRLELLREAVPGMGRVLVPYNPDDFAPSSAVRQIEKIAPDLGLELIKAHAHGRDEVATLLRELPAELDAIFLVPDSTVNSRLQDVLAVAFERRLPVSGPSMAQVEGGALMTFGFVHHEVGVQAARIAERVLKGAKPGELPVETAEFFLGFNLQTAQSLALEIPEPILQQAQFIVRPDTNN
jgi:putative ABC transport system substrate-binding protein